MAMIIEVLDGHGGTVRARVRVDALPLTIGRGFDNDVIVDDAYVDARHARVLVNADGQVEIEDLGTVNGLVRVGERARSPRVAAVPGTQVRIGRTTLRFRDPAEQVPPALHDRTAELALHERILGRRGARAAICAAALALIALQAWLGSYERGTAQTVIMAMFGIALIGAFWAGAWAIGARAAIGRFNFAAHYTIFSAVAVAAMALGIGDTWGTFLFPESRIWLGVSVVAWVALFTAGIALHLTQSSAMSAFRRWRAAGVMAAIACALLLIVEYTTREIYTDVPEFNAVLKHAPAALIPQIDGAEFTSVVDDLAGEADEMTDG